MASAGGLFSQTLQDITNTKLHELAKKRNSFEAHRQRLIASADSEREDNVQKLGTLAERVKVAFSVPISGGRVVRGGTDKTRLEIDLRNIDRFLAQARYDPCVSRKLLDQWQQSLLRHVQVQSLKFSFADLYGQLTTEWLSSKQQSPGAIAGSEDTEMGGFENISAGGKKMESRVKWERSVFEPTNVNQEAIFAKLRSLFEMTTPQGSKHMVKALNALRERTEEFERKLASQENFTAYTLDWTINGLLNSDLLREEQRTVLRDFKSNSVILNEIADVLNMRMAALDAWSWGDIVQMEERRQLNGNFNIYMHQDLLQAIFLQYIGVKWSVYWKKTFSEFRTTKDVWKTMQKSISLDDEKRRQYYLGHRTSRPSVDSKKRRIYRTSYFLSQLQESENQETTAEEGEEEADFEEMPLQQAQSTSLFGNMGQAALGARARSGGRTKQTARRSTGGQAPRKMLASRATRKANPWIDAEADEDEDEDSDAGFEDEEDDINDDQPRSPMRAKQTLLHLLSTDVLIKSRLHGEITCFRSQIDNLYPSLPHQTIKSVLSYFGVSNKWLEFFKRFLQAPLHFLDESLSEPPRRRRQGTPGAHALSDVFSEVVLFCLDFEVNQLTNGELLWRMHDDFWFWSSNHANCVKAWSAINGFGKTMGLSLNKAKTGGARMLTKKKSEPKDGSHQELMSVDMREGLPDGQIRWGMLLFNPSSGRFEIDQEMVDKHIEELNHQLQGKTKSLFAWIQAWNSYAATFFTSNFGKPANCFGRQHVDNMLKTHARIQRKIFSSSSTPEGSTSSTDPASIGGSVVGFLKQAIDQRFGIKDIPDGYFFFPTELGGLEVSSPFIGLLQIRDAVLDRPTKVLDDFEEAEREAYRVAKANFEAGKTGRKWSQFGNAKSFQPREPDTFFSFEEFTKYREELHYGFENELVDVFTKLLERPNEESIECDDNGDVMAALNALGRRSNLRGITASWYGMQPYWKWVTQLYGPEMTERFGGLSIVDPGLLPMGMVSLFKSGRVNWQE